MICFIWLHNRALDRPDTVTSSGRSVVVKTLGNVRSSWESSFFDDSSFFATFGPSLSSLARGGGGKGGRGGITFSNFFFSRRTVNWAARFMDNMRMGKDRITSNTFKSTKRYSWTLKMS